MLRCRSGWKLLELDAEYRLFTSECRTVVDLAAAPGAFAQVALQRMTAAALPEAKGVAPVVIALDQRPVAQMDGLLSAQCDITDHAGVMKCINGLLRGTQGGHDDTCRRVQVVLHDGVSVLKAQSAFSVTYGQNQMALSALRLACSLFSSQLRCSHSPQKASQRSKARQATPQNRGAFVTKVMYSTHFNTVLGAARAYFGSVNVHRPSECKAESLETYIVARDFLQQQWLSEERQEKGLHPCLSMPPHLEDVFGARQLVWRCWGCCRPCMGAVSCPLCRMARSSW